MAFKKPKGFAMFHFKALVRKIMSGDFDPSLLDQFSKKMSQREIESLKELDRICAKS